MLVLSRKRGGCISIGENIEVSVVHIYSNVGAILRVKAPAELVVRKTISIDGEPLQYQGLDKNGTIFITKQEHMTIGDEIRIFVCKIKGSKRKGMVSVSIGIDAPREIAVHRT